MIRAGVDIFRFNMSHGNHETHAAGMARVRKIARQLDRPTAILVDSRGVVRWTYESETYRQRADPEQIFRAIAQLN